jgi:phospholipid-translocating ATPase
MAVVQFAGDAPDSSNGNSDGNNHLQPPGSEISKPTKRQRWATQRKNNSGGLKKRVSIVDRFHRRGLSKEEKRKSAGSSADGNNASSTEDGSSEEEQQPPRHIYFNVPLPDSERDEEGNLKTHYPSNKIRTAKFTPLTFVPKDLWLQFHNIANIYFLFIIILGVRHSLGFFSLPFGVG